MEEKDKISLIAEYLIYRGAKESLEEYLLQTGQSISEMQRRGVEILEYIKICRKSNNNKTMISDLFDYFEHHHKDILSVVCEKFLEIVFLEKLTNNDLEGAFLVAGMCGKNGYSLNEDVYSLIGYEYTDVCYENRRNEFLEMLWDNVYLFCVGKEYPELIGAYKKYKNIVS